MLLIIGRTASGKDTLKRVLETRFNVKFVKSCATRPRRTPDEDTHVFLSAEEAAAVPDSEKAARTRIAGYEYFATRDQVKAADAYIIDPEGAQMLARSMPDTDFRVLCLVPQDKAKQEAAALSRAADPEAERGRFLTRREAEDGRFSLYEREGIPALRGIAPSATVVNHYWGEDELFLAYWSFLNSYEASERMLREECGEEILKTALAISRDSGFMRAVHGNSYELADRLARDWGMPPGYAGIIAKAATLSF